MAEFDRRLKSDYVGGKKELHIKCSFCNYNSSLLCSCSSLRTKFKF